MKNLLNIIRHRWFLWRANVWADNAFLHSEEAEELVRTKWARPHEESKYEYHLRQRQYCMDKYNRFMFKVTPI